MNACANPYQHTTEHSHGHAHHHHAHGHHHHSVPESMNRIFVFCVILNLLFVLVEAAAGLIYNSVGLLSDAGHNLSDVFSLLLVLLAFRMSKARASAQFTYGYKKGTVLISLVNAVILLVAVGAILIESIHKFRNPEPISGSAISITAGIGILINGLTTVLLMRGRHNDINVKGAFLHMLMDTLVSVGVVISGLVITYTNWLWVDPVIGILLALVILFSTCSLLKESLLMTLDAVPHSVHVEEIGENLDHIEGVCGWHHLHVWAISTTENAATVHVVVQSLDEWQRIKTEVKEVFHHAGICHCTLEVETQGAECNQTSCC